MLMRDFVCKCMAYNTLPICSIIMSAILFTTPVKYYIDAFHRIVTSMIYIFLVSRCILLYTPNT